MSSDDPPPPPSSSSFPPSSDFVTELHAERTVTSHYEELSTLWASQIEDDVTEDLYDEEDWGEDKGKEKEEEEVIGKKTKRSMPWDWIKGKSKRKGEKGVAPSSSSSSSPSSFQGTTINDLPKEIFFLIFCYLDLKSFVKCALVCHYWKEVYEDEALQSYILQNGNYDFNAREMAIFSSSLSPLKAVGMKWGLRKSLKTSKNKFFLTKLLPSYNCPLLSLSAFPPPLHHQKSFIAAANGRILLCDYSKEKEVGGGGVGGEGWIGIQGHSSGINDMQILCGNRRLITGSAEIKIWSIDTFLGREEEAGPHQGEIIKEMEAIHTLPVTEDLGGKAFCFQADLEKLIVSVTLPADHRAKGAIGCYDLNTMQFSHIIKPFPKETYNPITIRSLQFSENSLVLVNQRSAQMFDYRSNNVDRAVVRMKKGKGQAFVTQVSMSGNKVAVSDTENEISLYDIRNPSEPCHIFCPDTPEDRVYVRDARLDGGLLYSLHNSNQYQEFKGTRVFFWDVLSGECFGTISRKEGIKSKINSFDLNTNPQQPVILTAHGERGTPEEGNCVMAWHAVSSKNKLKNRF